MKIFSIIVICLLGLVLLVMSIYILIGMLCFKISLSRRGVAKKLTNAVVKSDREKYKIDYSWWEGQQQQTLSITSFDGLKLVAHLLPRKSDKLAILVHGYGGDYRDQNSFAQYFLSHDFNVLAVECRAHGNSEGNMVGMGWLDRLDLKDWIDFMIKQNPSYKIVLFGQSMGATCVCMTLGEKLPPNVICGISDCGFDNVFRQLYYVCKPSFKFLTKPVLNLFNNYCKRTKGFDLKQADATKQLKNCNLPVLFVHGKEDAFVPVQMCYRLSEALPEHRREVLIVDGADHIMSYPTDPKAYTRKLTSFLKKYNLL